MISKIYYLKNNDVSLSQDSLSDLMRSVRWDIWLEKDFKDSRHKASLIKKQGVNFVKVMHSVPKIVALITVHANMVARTYM